MYIDNDFFVRWEGGVWIGNPLASTCSLAESPQNATLRCITYVYMYMYSTCKGQSCDLRQMVITEGLTIFLPGPFHLFSFFFVYMCMSSFNPLLCY